MRLDGGPTMKIKQRSTSLRLSPRVAEPKLEYFVEIRRQPQVALIKLFSRTRENKLANVIG